MLPEFLEQQLRSKNIIDVVNSSTFGAKMPRADWTFMGDLALGFPPEYSEQSAIVRFLDHVDRRIRRYVRAKRRLIELLNEQKQAIVQRAVTRGLDPNVRLKPSGVEWLGDVPVDWEVSPLKRVARLQRGYDLPDYSRRKGIYPVISSGGIIGTHAVANVKGPGVVMGRYGSTGKIFFVESDFWPHNTALYVQDFQGNLPRYVFHLLHILNYGAHSGKSAVPGVDRKDLHDIQVPIAPILEQTRIIAYLDSELARIDILIEQTNSAIALSLEYRTRLIADVVTGKVDVRDLAASLPDTIEEEIPDDSVVADETDTQDDGLDPSEEATDVE
jgi:type I restriction enzyme S subunit